jgi:hypothetical protein
MPSRTFSGPLLGKHQEVLHLCEIFFRLRLCNSFSFQFLLLLLFLKKSKKRKIPVLHLLVCLMSYEGASQSLLGQIF